MHPPTSPLYTVRRDDQFAFPTSPLHKKSFGGAPNGTGNKIDYSKFKTKMCRNYVMGLPCPFEERCAFSHGEGDAERMAKIQQSMYLASQEDETEDSLSSTGSLASPKPRLTSGSLYAHRRNGAHPGHRDSTENFFSSNSSNEGNSYASFHHTSVTAGGAVRPGHNANATEFLPPPPPSYEAALTTMAYESMGGYSGVADKRMPPAYPTRYRHDPYSFAGIVYE